MNGCRFCEIIRQGNDYPIWENEKFLVLLNIKPSIIGTIMIIPKKHVDYLFDMPKKLYQEMFEVAKKLEPGLKKVMEAKRVGILASGFEIPHVHLFLLPLKEDFRKSPPRMLLEKEELEDLQKKIREELLNYS